MNGGREREDGAEEEWWGGRGSERKGERRGRGGCVLINPGSPISNLLLLCRRRMIQSPKAGQAAAGPKQHGIKIKPERTGAIQTDGWIPPRHTRWRRWQAEFFLRGGVRGVLRLSPPEAEL